MMENYPGYDPDERGAEPEAKPEPDERGWSEVVPNEASADYVPPPPPPEWGRPDIGYGNQPPPPPPAFQAQSNRGFLVNLARGLGIALLSCLAAIAGLAGACFMVVGMGSTDTIGFVLGSAAVFIAAVVALVFLIRPRKNNP